MLKLIALFLMTGLASAHAMDCRFDQHTQTRVCSPSANPGSFDGPRDAMGHPIGRGGWNASTRTTVRSTTVIIVNPRRN